MSGSTREESLAAIQGLYAAFESGDVEGALKFVDPDVVISYPGSMPMAGEWHGHQGLLELFGQVGALWIDRVSEVEAFVADGDRLVVLLTTKGKLHGKQVTMPIAEVWRVRDGRLVEGRLFFWDTAMIVDAVGTAA